MPHPQASIYPRAPGHRVIACHCISAAVLVPPHQVHHALAACPHTPHGSIAIHSPSRPRIGCPCMDKSWAALAGNLAVGQKHLNGAPQWVSHTINASKGENPLTRQIKTGQAAMPMAGLIATTYTCTATWAGRPAISHASQSSRSLTAWAACPLRRGLECSHPHHTESESSHGSGHQSL